MADVLAIALKLAIATLIACVAWGTFKVSKVIYRSVVLKRQFPNMPSESFIFGAHPILPPSSAEPCPLDGWVYSTPMIVPSMYHPQRPKEVLVFPTERRQSN